MGAATFNKENYLILSTIKEKSTSDLAKMASWIYVKPTFFPVLICGGHVCLLIIKGVIFYGWRFDHHPKVKDNIIKTMNKWIKKMIKDLIKTLIKVTNTVVPIVEGRGESMRYLRYQNVDFILVLT